MKLIQNYFMDKKISSEGREKIFRIFKALFRASLDKLENLNKKKLYEDGIKNVKLKLQNFIL